MASISPALVSVISILISDLQVKIEIIKPSIHLAQVNSSRKNTLYSTIINKLEEVVREKRVIINEDITAATDQIFLNLGYNFNKISDEITRSGLNSLVIFKVTNKNTKEKIYRSSTLLKNRYNANIMVYIDIFAIEENSEFKVLRTRTTIDLTIL